MVHKNLHITTKMGVTMLTVVRRSYNPSCIKCIEPLLSNNKIEDPEGGGMQFSKPTSKHSHMSVSVSASKSGPVETGPTVPVATALWRQQ